MFAPLFDARFAYDLFGPSFTGRPAVPIDWDLTYVWWLWGLLLLALVTPVALFLNRGWKHRREDILSNFSQEAAALYLLFFRSADGDKKSFCGELRTCWERRAQTRTDAQELRARARQFRDEAATKRAAGDAAAGAAAEAKANELNDQIAAADKIHEQALETWTGKMPSAEQVFVSYYNSQFGRIRFLVPGLLLVVVAGTLLLFPAAAALAELRAQGQPTAGAGAPAPAVGWVWMAALAILGGYTRAVFELVARTRQENVRPSDLMGCCFRLLISVPLGYALGASFGGDKGLAVAFLLGLFPTATIMTMGRRTFYAVVQRLNTEEEAPADALLVLPSLDRQTAELLNEEGIANATQLAYTDPVRLGIRTGLGFGYVVSCQSEALLAYYLVDRRRMEVVRLFGVRGAFEAATLLEELEYESGDPRRRAAEYLLTQMAARLEVIKLSTGDEQPDKPMTREGLVYVLQETAGDPYTWFIRETWATTVPA